MEVLRANARQLLGIAKTTYSNFGRGLVPDRCEDTASDADELACLYEKANAQYESWNVSDDPGSEKEVKEKLLKVS